ncbi:MAG: META domain-containing protein [Alphaproteobacteria bacterium]|nr:META domain-containing protein [Alphaproteobacteria bacterium]
MKKILMVLAGCAALTACASQDKNPLKGREFASYQDEIKITLNFDKEQPRLYGKVVNSYNAPYELAGDNIIVGRMASSMMMPIGRAAEVEHEYFKFMSDAEPKSYKLEGGYLTLSDHSGKSYKFEKIK